MIRTRQAVRGRDRLKHVRRIVAVCVLIVGGCGFHVAGSGAGFDASDAIQPDGPGGDALPLPIDALGINPDAATVTDIDGDGIVNASDNCPLIPNAQQYDEDADGVGDACDNCPHIANATQANIGETAVGGVADAVGDVCDPNPTLTGDDILLFVGFNTAADITGWTGSGATFTVNTSTGRLEQSATAQRALFYKSGLNLAATTVTGKITYLAIGSSFPKGAALLRMFAHSGVDDFGVGCGEQLDNQGGNTNDAISRELGGLSCSGASPRSIGDVFVGHSSTMSTSSIGGSGYQCTIVNNALRVYTDNSFCTQAGSGIGIEVVNAKIAVSYLIAID